MNGDGAAAAAGNGGGAVGTFRVKAGLAQMLKGGVIMGVCARGWLAWAGSSLRSIHLTSLTPCNPKNTDVVNVEQAKIAEEAGAVAVMALERIPADIRRDGGVARMSDPAMIREIKAAVTIPVMAKVRKGEARPTEGGDGEWGWGRAEGEDDSV